jgi:aminoglycoside phosphotransferase (APT) family kinase protein
MNLKTAWIVTPSVPTMPDILDCLPRLRELGLIEGEARLMPLTGGVSSDIVRVDSSKRSVVVKAALAKLRVRDDWFADVSRNAVELRFFEHMAPVIPAHVPRVLASGEGWFAMEYLGELPNWKTRLMQGEVDLTTARLAGEVLGRMHAATWQQEEARRSFDTLPNFQALRIEPYLMTTAERVPEAAEVLRAEASRLAKTRLALVHGDYSPKNLLTGSGRLIVLDAECAWFGDPAFDTAFMLTHLHLKALLHAPAASLIPAFWQAYTAACPHDLEQRSVRLLLCFLLARVHGKSPVEYLNKAQQELVTRFALAHLRQTDSLAAVTAAWMDHIRVP